MKETQLCVAAFCVKVLLLISSVAPVGVRMSRVSVSSVAVLQRFSRLSAFLLGIKIRTKLGKGISAL